MSLKNINMNGIAAELKSKILAESMVEGAVISSVAKKYNLSKGTIYHWMKQNWLFDSLVELTFWLHLN